MGSSNLEDFLKKGITYSTGNRFSDLLKLSATDSLKKTLSGKSDPTSLPHKKSVSPIEVMAIKLNKNSL